MRTSLSALLAFALASNSASAHMFMADPPALRGMNNPFTTDVDYSITTPLGGSSQWPCKGYHTLIGTPQGTPVKTWTAGDSYSFTIQGSAPHGGGSCQASISTDGGNTFKVIHSYIGGCPGLNGDSTFKFRLPADTPSSENALFSWTWFNLLGNREFYANCAVVKVVGGSSSEAVSISSRPDPFIANIGNGCTTVESKSVIFPNPGPDVDTADNNGAYPVGTCQAIVGGGVGSSGTGSSGTGSTPAQVPPPSGGDDSSYKGPASGYGGSSNSGQGGSYGGSSGGQGSRSGGYGGSYGSGAQLGYGQGPATPTYKPGNDWPAGFNSNSTSSKASGIQLLAAVVAVVFAGLLA
jgi:hypothetical protein